MIDEKQRSRPTESDPINEQFEALVSRFEAPLLRYATRILRDADAAQDVVQNTLIKLLKRWKDEFEPSPQMSTWLYRVAHNNAVDHIRKESRKRDLHVRHLEEEQTGENVARPELREPSEASELAERLLGVLSLREQQLVILKVYEEKSYRELSAITGLREGNVGYILHHAMKKMAQAAQDLQQP